MNALKGLLLGRSSHSTFSSTNITNITKYSVGARVPRNEKAERIVRNVLANRPSDLMKLK